MSDLPFLLVLFWLGFSLAFLIVACAWRFAVLNGKIKISDNEIVVTRVRFPLRVTISLFVLAGAAGAASWGGMILKEIEGASIVFLAGVALGVWTSIVLYPWSNRS